MSTDLQPQPAGLDRSRLRALAPIAVFDIVGPLAVYYLLRMTGGSQVMALILSGIVPAIGILVGVIRSRHVSAIGILVLVGILEVSGAWTAAIDWLKIHWLASYQSPL